MGKLHDAKLFRIMVKMEKVSGVDEAGSAAVRRAGYLSNNYLTRNGGCRLDRVPPWKAELRRRCQRRS